MSDQRDNVIDMDSRRREKPVVDDFCVPADPRDVVNLAVDADRGFSSVVFLRAPDGMWEIQDPDDVERLALPGRPKSIRPPGCA